VALKKRKSRKEGTKQEELSGGVLCNPNFKLPLLRDEGKKRSREANNQKYIRKIGERDFYSLQRGVRTGKSNKNLFNCWDLHILACWRELKKPTPR